MTRPCMPPSKARYSAAVSAPRGVAIRSAAAGGGSLSELFAIPAREKIGRMESVAEEQYKDAYANLLVEMEEEIGAIAEKGEKDA